MDIDFTSHDEVANLSLDKLAELKAALPQRVFEHQYLMQLPEQEIILEPLPASFDYNALDSTPCK